MNLLTRTERQEYYNEISRTTFYQPIIQENGTFEIYNVKENDLMVILTKLNSLPFIEYANKSSSKLDLSHLKNGLPTKQYRIIGKIKA